MSCCFNKCSQPSLPLSNKCAFHRNRRSCQVDDCHNQVFARNLCVRHGGKRLCSYPECLSNARIAGRCARHGTDAPKRTCNEASCYRIAHRLGRCIRHGGGRPCKTRACPTHARSGGYCWRHRPSVSSPVTAESPQDLESPRWEALDALDAHILASVLADVDPGCLVTPQGVPALSVTGYVVVL
ncbi:hypothetical protein SPRG_13564 [Saprolegnia parasitica CBS 223.65]|uniref:Uncharacterized protein n=1 Tax=Saprolegnia parasitica (strain CBS 223.65) TaxID=695850 RepID=A0A067BWQ4_SAPPC|nr:hypothetical protein SPRG_13564 [Saprolegnia parasitica CBS 223.65]KDO21265.1 hypothetical protein SPRG_13564 [Saprolegnia parasitica CBS 223.65]|eukprot:XP_012208009.1 hypothetical protein SPRG_13564 [Saprolegnia parasitica CBS 223.65]